MKTALIALLLLASVAGTQAQIRALTSEGDEVILYEDGTWKYADTSISASKEISINPATFTQSNQATFSVKSKILPVSVMIDPKKWSFSKGKEGESAEFNFASKDKEVHAIAITEEFEIPLLTLRRIAIENAREAAPDIALVKEEYRTVNGVKVLCMQMHGTIEGISFTYLGYYYSGEKGVCQLITYTAQKSFAKYEKYMEEFLNGFVVKQQ